MNTLKKVIPMLLLALVLVAGITLLGPEALATESDIFVDDYVYGGEEPLVIDVVYGQAVVLSCDWTVSDVYIPHTFDGYPVAEIAHSAFAWCEFLEGVNIPDSVYHIGPYAFNGCSKLPSIALPEGIYAVYCSTFAGCSSLKEIYIPSTIEFIEDNAFAGCKGLTDVYFNGTKAEWDQIDKSPAGNEALENAYIHFVGGSVSGDLDGDDSINNSDVVLLLWHVLFPNDYPISGNVDINRDGSVNNNDVVLLLWHVLFPEDYPI